MRTPYTTTWRMIPFVLGIALIVAFGQTPAAAMEEDSAQAARDVSKARPDKDKKADKGKKEDKKKKDKKKDDFPKFDEFAKDHKEVFGPEGTSGFFPLFFNKKTDQLLCVIPKSMLEKNFLLASSIAGGPGYAGWMWGSQVLQWHEIDKKLVLIEPDLRHMVDKKSTVKDVVDRTYTDRIVTSTKIVSKRGGDPVIDLGDLFKKDFAGVSKMFGGSMDSSLSRWAKYKSFPNNIEVSVDGAFMRDGSGTRAQVHYSIVKLPKNDYKPREADNRLGYFLTVRKDWSTKHDADTIFKRYVNRWDVRKAEPDQEISDVDPEHRITFYIEKTVPVKYRRYVREGILAWNKAFEKAGFRNAIKVEQQTDTVHADKDPEDVRYSFLRWIVSGRAFAMGPSLANPLTGQILDADIIFDDALARSFAMQYARFSGTAPNAAGDLQLQEFLEHHPEWRFTPLQEQLLPKSTRYAGVDVTLDPKMLERLSSMPGFCTCGQELAHEMTFANAYLKATGNARSSEEFVGQMIKYVTAHEVGHTLGLRHNFKASSWKTIEEIMANEDPNVPTVASVMDYIAPLLHADPKDQKLFVTQAVGPYDDLAIMYGYATYSKDSDYKNEKEMLAAISARVAEDGLPYLTDEDTSFFGPDPQNNRWDNGKDVIKYAKHRMAMVRTLQDNIADWAVEDGESYYRLRQMFDMLLSEYGRSAGFAARYVGGQHINRDHKGDPNARPPIAIVSVEKQREAFDFLIDTIFSDKDFQFDPELLNKLAAGRWSHWDSDAMDSQLDYPIHDRIAGTQFGTLFQLLNPFTLARIYDAELKVPADQDAVTVPEVVGRTCDAIWAELKQSTGSRKFTNRTPCVSSIRRSLQRQHLRMLLNVVLADPGGGSSADIHAVVWMKLKTLSENLANALEKGTNLDDFTRAHFDEARSRIDRALEAEYRL